VTTQKTSEPRVHQSSQRAKGQEQDGYGQLTTNPTGHTRWKGSLEAEQLLEVLPYSTNCRSACCRPVDSEARRPPANKTPWRPKTRSPSKRDTALVNHKADEQQRPPRLRIPKTAERDNTRQTAGRPRGGTPPEGHIPTSHNDGTWTQRRRQKEPVQQSHRTQTEQPRAAHTAAQMHQPVDNDEEYRPTEQDVYHSRQVHTECMEAAWKLTQLRN
jgi:hypothetical protein